MGIRCGQYGALVACWLFVSACGRVGYGASVDGGKDDGGAAIDMPVVDMHSDLSLGDMLMLDAGSDAALDMNDSAVDMDGMAADMDEMAAITVSPTSGLITTELGGTATFTVVLAASPTANVSIDIASSDSTEGTVSEAALTFTTVDWAVPQTVTLTGVDDPAADGDQDYEIVLAHAVSTDTHYDGLDPGSVHVTNIDDETAGVTLSRVTGLVTTESGGTDTFTIQLNAAPSADVTLMLSSSDSSEASVSPTSVIFTALSWAAPQIITVSGEDDATADGDASFDVVTSDTVSADVRYAGLVVPDVNGINRDDETPGISVSPTSGLITTEAGGTASFEVRLNTMPSADVTIGLSSSDPSEGSLSVGSLVFTTSNWDTAQTVTVIGVDDAVADGSQVYTVQTAAAVSADLDYDGIDASDVAITNADDDSGAIIVSPTSGLVTTEFGGDATFDVVLGLAPLSNVTVPLTSSNPGEGTVSAPSVTFTPVNWATPQTVTVTGVDDGLLDNDVLFSIVTGAAISTDPAFSGVSASDVSVTNVGSSHLVLASNPDADDQFGGSVALSGDGSTLAVGAIIERSTARGIGGNQLDNSAFAVGAVYVYRWTGAAWAFEAYIKASNADEGDIFGQRVRLSADGNTLAVTAPVESSNATGINGNQSDNSANQSGAAYIFVRAGSTWTQQAYIKQSNTANGQTFGWSASLSADGNVFAAGAFQERGISTGINGDESDQPAFSIGAAYIFRRVGVTWSQEAYVKPSSTHDVYLHFGLSVALSADGTALAVGAEQEDSDAVGINGDDTNSGAMSSGAAYVFRRTGVVWAQEAFIKASNSEHHDYFGFDLALSSDGTTLAVSATNEDSDANGIDGDQLDNSALDSGAAYVFRRTAGTWAQEAYLKAAVSEGLGADESDGADIFGYSVALSLDGSTLLVGATNEASASHGVNGDETDNSAEGSGAAYVFRRTGATWSQRAFLKSEGPGGAFGHAVAMSGSGGRLAVGADRETPTDHFGAVTVFSGH